jgi:HTH-type transcriptional regulator, sugar sensing transcriptional regulator
MNERLLEEIGLTKGETTVYLTLLKLGETTTGKIVETAQISSGKIYEILNRLIAKGLASYIVKEKTKYFIAASPNRIVDYLHEKEREVREKEAELLKELPALLAVEKAGEKEYETTLFRGFKGFQTAIFEALHGLTPRDEVLAMGIVSRKEKQYNLAWQKWHRERIAGKIACKAIFSDRRTDYYGLFKKMKHTEVRVIDGITPSAVDVMGNRVLILTYGKEPSCLSVKNPEIAQSFRTFFYNLWRIAKK